MLVFEAPVRRRSVLNLSAVNKLIVVSRLSGRLKGCWLCRALLYRDVYVEEDSVLLAVQDTAVSRCVRKGRFSAVGCAGHCCNEMCA